MNSKKRPLLTHFALRSRNIDESVAFYKKYVGLDLISERKEHTTRVGWLGNPEVHEQFIIVLLEMEHDAEESTSFHHIGIDLCSREKVDEIANLAREEGILALEPDDHGPVAGYLCIIKDPDGNQVEFSSGQEVFEVLEDK